MPLKPFIWAAPSKFGTYRLCEQRRFRRACASAQSRQNLRYSLIQAVSQEKPSDRKPDPWLLWMAGHAQLKFVMTECSKTQIRLAGPIWYWNCLSCVPLSEQNKRRWTDNVRQFFTLYTDQFLRLESSVYIMRQSFVTTAPPPPTPAPTGMGWW